MGKYLRFKFLALLVFLLLSITSATYGKTSEEYVDDVYKLINKGQFDEALIVVRKGMQEYPGDIGLVFAGAEVYHNLKDYETAIANYVNLLKAIASTGKEAPAELHYDLVDAYNELGQKHYFSKELCLRIIYHNEKYLELSPETPKRNEIMEFLRKTIGHFDVASMGTGNVKMMETGGDGAEFQLPEDNISNSEKLQYKDKAIQRLKEYDGAQKESAFRTVTSDKTVGDIIQLINQRVSVIKSIHFKRMNSAGGINTLLEEITYKSPDRIKVVEPNATSVIRDKDYYVVDPQNNKVISQDRLDPAKLSLLKGIGFYNLQEDLESYNLTVEKIAGCPDFLSEICSGSSLDLYLITGRLKDKDKGPYPPTPKVEYFIDAQTGLCIAKREYWLGVLGSGKEEELAKETIIKRIEQRPEGISLPSVGVTRGHVEELADLKQDWTVNVLSINQEIDDREFSVSK
jgi:tetratricopeptide (TPR) repeat protein